jgi:cobalt-precorrin 5A hydrolase/precorrin-3B C17-methyltransferase
MPIVFNLGPSARPLAEQLACHLKGTICEPEDLRSALHHAFNGGHPIIGLCAAGILIRLLAPLLADKFIEPPVIAVAEDGSVAVPLLGGHHGANELAREVAAITGGTAAITTASDLHFGLNLETIEGYVLANPVDLKPFLVKLLAGEKIQVRGNAPWLSALPQAPGAKLSIVITEHAARCCENTLIYHPQVLTLGVGCERATPPHELSRHVAEQLAKYDLAEKAIACIATIELKADEPAIHELAHELNVPVRFFSNSELNEESPRLKNPSEIVRHEVGCPSVAEASALRAAGPNSQLIAEKTVCNRTTCAIACATSPIDPNKTGRARGSLSIVGIGPGSPAWRSPAAETALRRATDWVGYGPYLDLVPDLRREAREHRFPLGDEQPRAVHALNCAAEGRDVALVCSGDAGIYAMAALVFELLDPASNIQLTEAAHRIAIQVIPGVSAFQAAAARAGAIIGHDFCAISLSDLLTPWSIIEQRLQAAAEGDFVIALYNPRSLRRSEQLDRAMAVIRPYRHADTPVVVASNLGRPQEKTRIVRFCDFDASDVDMLTIVIVGSASSRAFRRGDGSTVAYTPRGYVAKRKLLT